MKAIHLGAKVQDIAMLQVYSVAREGFKVAIGSSGGFEIGQGGASVLK